MKLYQNALRALILTGSLGGFLGGWTLIAHSGKPAPAAPQPAIVDPAPLPTLAPLDFSNNLAPAQLQPLQPLPQAPAVSQLPRPRLRTRGS